MSNVKKLTSGNGCTPVLVVAILAPLVLTLAVVVR